MSFKLSDLKNEIKKSGSNKGKFLYFREGEKIRVRFLTDLEDGVEVVWHDSYKQGINVPCQESFGRECKYCDDDDLRTRNMYIWSVYDYDSKEVKLLMAAVNQCSPVGALVALYEEYGTLLDRDYVIKQVGSGQSKSFSVIPQDKAKFRNAKAKPLSDSAILKHVDKAYPDPEADEYDDEEEGTPKRNKTKGNKQKKKEPAPDMNEPEEEDWGEDEEERKDYEDMKPQELYKLCKDRNISCKPKKAKEYYIDLLEEADEESDEGWGEDEDEEDDW